MIIHRLNGFRQAPNIEGENCLTLEIGVRARSLSIIASRQSAKEVRSKSARRDTQCLRFRAMDEVFHREPNIQSYGLGRNYFLIHNAVRQGFFIDQHSVVRDSYA